MESQFAELDVKPHQSGILIQGRIQEFKKGGAQHPLPLSSPPLTSPPFPPFPSPLLPSPPLPSLRPSPPLEVGPLKSS